MIPLPPTIRLLTASDWPAVAGIYAEGLASGLASFETAVPTWPDWNRGHLPAGRLVATASGVVGWAALSPVSSRPCYRGVAEVSVYVSATARRRGVGQALLTALVDAAGGAGLWTLQASVFRRNRRSVELFRRCGFRTVGVRERLAERDGVWHDVVLLERRVVEPSRR